MNRHGLIVMTALVPTIGHQYLINFAQNFMATGGNDHLHVVICGRPQEPIRAFERMFALKQNANGWNVTFYSIENDPPQNPEDHPNFWKIWTDIVATTVGRTNFDFLFASEMYAVRFAECFGAQFIPCDIDREVFNVKGTNVRTNLVTKWDEVVHSFKPVIRKRITFFGAESTGKTTTSKKIAELYGARWIHEWARPYLERFGPETTVENMKTIERAQFAAQKGVWSIPDTALVVQDTDLLSTIGYYRIYCGQETDSILDLFDMTKSHLYILMSSDIDFTPDLLRYGGDRRESMDYFWIDLLEEFGCNYRVVSGKDYYDRIVAAEQIVHEFIEDDPVAAFVRD